DRLRSEGGACTSPGRMEASDGRGGSVGAKASATSEAIASGFQRGRATLDYLHQSDARADHLAIGHRHPRRLDLWGTGSRKGVEGHTIRVGKDSARPGVGDAGRCEGHPHGSPAVVQKKGTRDAAGTGKALTFLTSVPV